jgi:tRNA(Ile)-lysidine synthase
MPNQIAHDARGFKAQPINAIFTEMRLPFLDKLSLALGQLSETELNAKLLIAVSGGGDSMAMLHALCFQNLNLAVAHVNYKQRGEDSDADENLVKQFCSENNLPFHSIDWPHGKGVSSFQEKARDFRYAFFNELKQSENCSLLLTAHHQNDRIEGFVYNMARGAGLSGMDALIEKNDAFFRPLFRMSKQEIDAYLVEHSVPFRLDKSNLKSTYKRNFIRLEVLPKMEEIHPKAFSNIAQLLDKSQMAVAEIRQLYKGVEERYIYVIKHSFGSVMLWDVSSIKNEVVDIKGFLFFVLKPKVKELHHRDIDQLARHFGEFHSESKIFYLGSYCLEFYRNDVFTYTIDCVELKEKFISSFSELETLVRHHCQIKELQGMPLEFEPGKLYLDADKLQFPLLLRSPRDGDKICLFGMQGKMKKVSDLLTQEKYAQWQKKTTCLIFDADNELVIFNWQRHSEKLRVNQVTKKTIILS